MGRKNISQEKIIQAFLASAFEKSAGATSLSDIAEYLEIKKASLYNHFPSKQAIFDAIVEETSKEFEKNTDEVAIHVQNSARDVTVFSKITEDDLVEKVHQIFNISLHDENIALFRKMMTIEQFRSDELSKLYSERYVERIVAYHAGIFKSLIAAGELKKEDPYTLAMMYVAPIIMLIGVCDRQPEREKECLEKIDEHVKLFYRTYNTLI